MMRSVASRGGLTRGGRDLIHLLGLVAVGLAIAGWRLRWLTDAPTGPANVDEKISLEVLSTLHSSPNPHFFHYGTFWFYILRALVFVVGASDPAAWLTIGRSANWFLWIALGPAVYFLARSLGAGYGWGLLSGLAALAAPQVFRSATYVNVDLAATFLSTVSIAYAVRYFVDGGRRNWMGFVIAAGFAMSTKYTAALLLVAFLAAEVIRSDGTSKRWPPGRLGARAPGVLLAVLAATALLFALAGRGPLTAALHGGSDNEDARVEPSDLAAVDGALELALVGGVLLAVAAAVTLIRPQLAGRLRPVALYATLGVTGLVALAGTPFALIELQQFVYQAGAELASNQGTGSAQWGNVARWMLESVPLLMLVVGLATAVVLYQRPGGHYMALLTGLTILTLGLSTRGFPRYVLALLPSVLALAAWGLTWAERHASGPTVRRWGITAAYAAVAASLVIGLASIDSAPR